MAQLPVVSAALKQFTPEELQRAGQDAQLLRRAMKGAGTDEATLISILGNRNDQQIDAIKYSYQFFFGRGLKEHVGAETSLNFKACLKLLLTEPWVRDAKSINKAVKGLGTNESLLFETLSTRSNAQLLRLAQTYQIVYGQTLEQAVIGDTSGDFKDLLVAILKAQRDETNTVDHAKVKADVEAFYKAGAGKLGTNESVFIDILVNRNAAHLKEFCNLYLLNYKEDIDTVIKKETSGDFMGACLSLIKLARSRAEYFADRLNQAMTGAGTDDATLIRVIVTQRGANMQAIKQAYQAKYGKPLEESIQKDTSGTYAQLLVALVGLKA